MTRTAEDFAATLRFEDVPPPLLALLRRSFLDTMGVAATGSTTEMSRIARQAAPVIFGGQAARMLFDGGRASAAGAAMAGAFTVDAIDAHDGTTPNKGHAGSAVWPAMLAMAEVLSPSAQEFATWMALAYEVSYRAGQAQHATCEDYHTSGAWTAVGVAVAAARALGASRDQIRHAAGIGEYHGPRSQMMRCIDHPTMVRDGVGWGAPAGVSAAYLAKDGFTGAPALTCEEPGFWQDLGDRWLTLEHTHYKLYPCCRWAHPAMDAALALMVKHKLAHTDIAAIEIRTFHYATRLAGHEPKTLDEFSYAIAFPVAAIVVRGQIGPEELRPETLNDPDILRLSRATMLIDDPELTARSVKQRWAQVTLVTYSGTRLEAPPSTPRGDADQPLSDAEIEAKYHRFADPTLGAPRAAELRDLAQSFDALSPRDFKRLLDLCTAPIASP
ncbi:MAG: MmgE/PrpD family protein [Pseudomonadota bacterium]